MVVSISVSFEKFLSMLSKNCVKYRQQVPAKDYEPSLKGAWLRHVMMDYCLLHLRRSRPH